MAPLRLRGDQPGQAVDKPDGIEILQALPESGNGAAIPHGDGDIVRHLPAQLLHDLQRHRFLALGEIGVNGGVAVVPAIFLNGLFGKLKGFLIVALHGDEGAQPRRRGVARQRAGGVAGGGAGDDLRSGFPCLGHRHGAGAILQGRGGVLAVVLDIQALQPQHLRQTGVVSSTGSSSR